MFGMEKSRKILVIIIMGSIIVTLLGIYVFYLSNPKVIFLNSLNAINNKVVDTVTANLDVIKLYDQNFVSDIEFEYFTEKEEMKEERIVTVDKKTKEETVTIQQVPYTEVTTRNFNANININTNNKYDIVQLTLPKENEETKPYTIYYDNGSLIFDDISCGRYLRLEDGILTKKMTTNTTFEVISLYQQIYKQITKEFKEKDIFKLPIKGEDIFDVSTKYGITLSQDRVKTIIIQALEKLANNQEFLNTLISYQNGINVHKTIDKEAAVLLIQNEIEKIKQYEVDPSIYYELVITTKGFFNDSIKNISLLELNNGTILKSVNAQINDDTINIELNKGFNDIYNIDVDKNDNRYEIKVKGKNHDIVIKCSGYLFDKEMSIDGIVDNKQITGKFSIEGNNDKELTSDVYFSVNNGQRNIMQLKCKNSTQFGSVPVKIENKGIFTIEEVFEQSKEYIYQFKREMLERLGIKL